jgi:hypothetical protein
MHGIGHVPQPASLITFDRRVTITGSGTIPPAPKILSPHSSVATDLPHLSTLGKHEQYGSQRHVTHRTDFAEH